MLEDTLMKIALAQMDVVPNRPEDNLNRMLDMIDSARKNGVDLIVFPEMCLSGYVIGDKFTDEEYCADLMGYNDILREASRDIAIVYGNIYVDDNVGERTGNTGIHPNEDGRTRKYNAAYIFQNQKLVQRANHGSVESKLLPPSAQPKTLLANYRFFDDKRYFFSTRQIAEDFGVELNKLLQPFKIMDREGKTVNVGLEVCEDLWCEDYRLNGDALNVTRILTENGADIIINISASPWTYGKNDARDRRIQFLKKDAESHNQKFVPFFYVNCVGAQNNGKNIITFDGGSTAYNHDAQIIKMSPQSYAEDLLVVDTQNSDSLGVIARGSKPKIAEKYEAVLRGIRHTKDMFGLGEHLKFFVGLSGGIDSSLAAALLCQAVGRERVYGINMPTIHNSEKTKNAAGHVASKLGIAYGIIPIQKIADAIIDAIENTDLDGSGKKLSQLNLENVQAKVRGTDILSNIASKYGGVFTNNGNKLEVALGYATLYGDVGGAIAPLADLTKEEVFEMARYINEQVYHDDVIPEILLPDSLFRFRKDQIVPSAELKQDQIDPMKFGYHDRLLERVMDYRKTSIVQVMQWYIDGTLEKNLEISPELIKRWGVDDPKEFIKDIEWFFSSIDTKVFKRVQSPPIIITSKTAFGYDKRESMMPYSMLMKQRELGRKILQMRSYYDR